MRSTLPPAGRDRVIADVLTDRAEELFGLLDGASLLGRRLGGERRDPAAGRVGRVIDLVELDALGPDEDLAGTLVG